MNMVKLNWKPSASHLRKFGAVQLIGWGCIGGVLYLLGMQVFAQYLWIFGLCSGLTGLTGTVLAYPFYYFLMAFAYCMGTGLGILVLSVIYYLVLSPLALIARATGRDKLQLKQRKNLNTYWQPIATKPKTMEFFERQF